MDLDDIKFGGARARLSMVLDSLGYNEAEIDAEYEGLRRAADRFAREGKGASWRAKRLAETIKVITFPILVFRAFQSCHVPCFNKAIRRIVIRLCYLRKYHIL